MNLFQKDVFGSTLNFFFFDLSLFPPYNTKFKLYLLKEYNFKFVLLK